MDQPIGTGFSDTSYRGDIRASTEAASVDFYDFLQVDSHMVKLNMKKKKKTQKERNSTYDNNPTLPLACIMLINHAIVGILPKAPPICKE